MNGEMHKVKGNITEFRLIVWCLQRIVVSDLKIRERDKDGNDDVFLFLLFGALFLSKSALCLVLFMQKIFSADD